MDITNIFRQGSTEVLGKLIAAHYCFFGSHVFFPYVKLAFINCLLWVNSSFVSAFTHTHTHTLHTLVFFFRLQNCHLIALSWHQSSGVKGVQAGRRNAVENLFIVFLWCFPAGCVGVTSMSSATCFVWNVSNITITSCPLGFLYIMYIITQFAPMLFRGNEMEYGRCLKISFRYSNLQTSTMLLLVELIYTHIITSPRKIYLLCISLKTTCAVFVSLKLLLSYVKGFYQILFLSLQHS